MKTVLLSADLDVVDDDVVLTVEVAEVLEPTDTVTLSLTKSRQHVDVVSRYGNSVGNLETRVYTIVAVNDTHMVVQPVNMADNKYATVVVFREDFDVHPIDISDTLLA